MLYRHTTTPSPLRWTSLLAGALALFILLSAMGAGPARADHAPRIAVVKCGQTYERDWFGSDASGKSTVGLATLLGVHYETIGLDELLASSPLDYSSVWFSSCQWVSSEDYPLLLTHLEGLVAAGRSVFLDGPLGVFYLDEQGDDHWRAMDAVADILGIDESGWYSYSSGYTLDTSDSQHAIALRAGYGEHRAMTLDLWDGAQTMELHPLPGAAGAVLLEAVSLDDGSREPFLVVNELPTDSRVLAIGSYGTHMSVATPFQKDPTPTFFDNQVLPYLLDSLVWLLADEDQPFAGLQLSHAPMTMVGRLDADWSDDGSATETTLDYLIALARSTGITTVYGVLTGHADDAWTWPVFRDRGSTLQELGGTLGSHSRTHDNHMTEVLDEQGWEDEVAGSFQDLRDALTDTSFGPDAYAFVNPGNTIRSESYPHFFDDVELYMTHGFEMATPYGTGVQGFGGAPETPVIHNVVAPDYQWLYSSSWTTTVAEAATFQAHILDYYQDTVGRGVVYNQMWHDYAISNEAPPSHDPEVDSTWPLYDTAETHFHRARVYAPSIRELVGKMHVAKRAVLTSAWSSDTLSVTIDYGQVPAEHRSHAAGMGVRIHLADAPIESVLVDGEPHHAFSDDSVLLPMPLAAQQVLSVVLGEHAPGTPRLLFSSKPVQGTQLDEQTLTAPLVVPGRASRFCFASPTQVLVFDADEIDNDGQGELCGRLRDGNPSTALTLTALPLAPAERHLRYASVPIAAAYRDEHRIVLDLSPAEDGEVRWVSSESPTLAALDEVSLPVTHHSDGFSLFVPASSSHRTLEIHFADCLLPEGCTVDIDAGIPDAAVPDAGIPDASIPDASIPDASTPDAAPVDAALPDAALPDAALPDAATADAGTIDSGLADAAVDAPDASPPPLPLPGPGPSRCGSEGPCEELAPLDSPETPETPPRNGEGGCGCQSSSGDPGAPLSLLLILAYRARPWRRRDSPAIE